MQYEQKFLLAREREFTSLGGWGFFFPRCQSSLIFLVFGGKYQYVYIDLDTIRSETFPGLERYIFLSVLDSRELVFCRTDSQWQQQHRPWKRYASCVYTVSKLARQHREWNSVYSPWTMCYSWRDQWLQLGHRRTENWRTVVHIPKERWQSCNAFVKRN